MSIDDRRAQGATRFPFEALVEVGGSLGPSFEAQAIDVSDDGMHLRTAYLPEIGQPLTCRFDAANESVMAAGEVVWNQEAGKGGEFGIRFTGLDADSAAAVARITQTNAALGTRVRLHIEGLGSPMRARVRDSNRAELTVGSELGFLLRLLGFALGEIIGLALFLDAPLVLFALALDFRFAVLALLRSVLQEVFPIFVRVNFRPQHDFVRERGEEAFPGRPPRVGAPLETTDDGVIHTGQLRQMALR